MDKSKKGFGTAPVFFTAISTILGAILFLRFGYATGMLGFGGVVLIILIGHLVTIPTALAISEIATNEKVKGGGEYFIISRSFGLNIGATIGIALYLSQAISVAFYVIAFTEAFTPIFELIKQNYGIVLPKQVVSVPTLILLGILILKKGASMGVKLLYIVVGILFLSLLLFFLGKPTSQAAGFNWLESFRNTDKFFIVFAIVFPAFTGMTAGVGLSGDLKDPKKSIPIGTLAGVIVGMIVYFFVTYKLAISASPQELISDQLIMSKIAVFGSVMIPLGLAASTISSAIGSILVAPRTLQALSKDEAFPSKKLNKFLAAGKGELNEPLNATLVTSAIALGFVLLGSINEVASIITMFFMVTYGSISLISFLHHFGSDPSYRPTFRSRWYVSLLGFLLAIWLMFKISFLYALLSLVLITIIYFVIVHYHKDRKGLEAIFQGAIYQFSRKIQVFLQQSKKKDQGWRPSAICVSRDSFKREKAIHLLSWIAYSYGFGTYIHLIEGYYSKQTSEEAKAIHQRLLEKTKNIKGNIIVDTIISPSFTSAIAQAIQLPSSSGMENNMVIFEFDKQAPDNLNQILENVSLVQAGNFDVCILGSSSRSTIFANGIHVWITNWDGDNANLMILLSYIILGHPDWHESFIQIFSLCPEGKYDKESAKLKELVETGRLPISPENIEVIEQKEGVTFKQLVNERSSEAALTLIGFKQETIRHQGRKLFEGYDNIGDVLFVDAAGFKRI